MSCKQNNIKFFLRKSREKVMVKLIWRLLQMECDRKGITWYYRKHTVNGFLRPLIDIHTKKFKTTVIGSDHYLVIP